MIPPASVAPAGDLHLDLATPAHLPPLPLAYLAGRDLDLLEPLRFLAAPPDVSAVAAAAAAAAPEGSAATAAARRARAELAAAIAASNHSFGHPAADEVCRKLADPATRVVVTGQQPGLFGGPLMTFAKAVAASRYAAALEALGEPAVAVFWAATEDHDWSEISHAAVLAAGGPRNFDLGSDPEPLLPAGMRTMPQAITAILHGLAAAVPGEAYASWIATLSSWYGPFACVGTAFCRSLTAMLGARCPLLLDAMHPALKAAERPYMARLVERRAALEEALAARDAAITARGYELRVSPQRGASPLFLLHGAARRRIAWQGADGFVLRGMATGTTGGGGGATRGTVADLLLTIDENPSVVSPGVLARPAVADAVLGSVLQVLGPGELSYMAQAAAVYPILEVAAPHVALRPQTLILDPREREQLGELGLPLATVLGDRHQLDRTLVARAGGDFVAPVTADIEAAFARLPEAALAADPKLARPLAKTHTQIERALNRFADRALPAVARRDFGQSRRVEALRQSCLPGGKPQERVIAAAHFQGRYGGRLADSYWEQLDLDPRRLSVIVP